MAGESRIRVSSAAGSRGFGAYTLRLFAGVVIWAVHFAAIYAFTALACARGYARQEWLGASVVTWGIVAAGLVAGVAAIAVAAAALRGAQRSFERWMSAGVAALALIAILWETLPVTLLPVCG